MEHLQGFQTHVNSRHFIMLFTIETNRCNKMSFLNVNVIRKQDKFTTNVYQKPTFSGV